MKCSICIATYNKPEALQRTLESIIAQAISLEWELIVVDDGSPGNETYKVCSEFRAVRYTRIDREPKYRNPSAARNLAYRQAKGEIIICQSDDVIHYTPDSVERLVSYLLPRSFVLATVINVDSKGNPYRNVAGKGYGDHLQTYVSPQRKRALFFLGALRREDLYAVGGNDEEFTVPSGEDRWFALCLINGRKLKPIYTWDVVGHHQAHTHCDPNIIQPSQILVQKKTTLARSKRIPWCSSRGSWYFPLPPCQ